MKISRSALALLPVVLLLGCGSDTSGEGGAPANSAITINPSSLEWTVAGNTSANYEIRQAYTISVTNSTGNPVQDATVEIYLDLAPGTSTGPQVLELLDATGTTRVSPFITKTDSFGNVRVYVDLTVGPVGGNPANGGLAYRGFLQAFSGSAFANSSIQVTCEDTNSATTDLCD